jgi:hypothetical protein
MKLNKFKFATFFFIGVLTTSIILGCFIMIQDFSAMEMKHGAKSSECCGSSAASFINHLGPNTQYTLASSMALVVINFIFAVVIFLYLKSDVFANYYLIKDRYGGFKLFYKFTLLFSTGILHPKLY